MLRSIGRALHNNSLFTINHRQKYMRNCERRFSTSKLQLSCFLAVKISLCVAKNIVRGQKECLRFFNTRHLWAQIDTHGNVLFERVNGKI